MQFVQAFVPTYQAAELLLFFAANPGLDFSPEELVSAMRAVVVAEPAVREYTAHFAAKAALRARGTLQIQSDARARAQYQRAGVARAKDLSP